MYHLVASTYFCFFAHKNYNAKIEVIDITTVGK